MDHYAFTLTRQYEAEDFCQTVRIKLAAEDIHSVVSAFADFLESAGFPTASVAASLAAASAR